MKSIIESIKHEVRQFERDNLSYAEMLNHCHMLKLCAQALEYKIRVDKFMGERPA